MSQMEPSQVKLPGKHGANRITPSTTRRLAQQGSHRLSKTIDNGENHLWHF